MTKKEFVFLAYSNKMKTNSIAVILKAQISDKHQVQRQIERILNMCY